MDDVSCSHSCTWPDCAAEIARLTEQCAVLEASNRIRGDELARLRAVEPVAWMDDFGNAFPLAANKGAGSWMDEHKRHWKPLYLAAPPAQPATRKDCGEAGCAENRCGNAGCLPSAQPAAQPVQRLSDDALNGMLRKMHELQNECNRQSLRSAIEAALQPQGWVLVPVDFDVQECIKAGYKLHRYAQGTGPCVAFYRGAKWLASTGENAMIAVRPGGAS